MTLVVRNIDLYVLNMRTRMPFKYGIASMNVVPHLFVRTELEVGGKRCHGIASDGLPPKWFTKDPETSYRDDLEDMLQVIRTACESCLAIERAASPFRLWRQLVARQEQWAAGIGTPPLLWNLGVSLVERAVLDAFCRLREVTFARALRENLLGMELGELYAELDTHVPADLLPLQPLPSTLVRHTVGLADPLTGAEIPKPDRLRDGLPQSLEASIRQYGLKRFKIKLSGDTDSDLARLRRLATTIPRDANSDFGFTLDGNEQFQTIAEFRAFWERILSEPSLDSFTDKVIFVEQPLHRDAALAEGVGEELAQWGTHPPIVIDESDAALGDLSIALDRGYAGTSHKNCKGTFKGIANACLIGLRRLQDPETPYILSGEDLANVGPVALIQDLLLTSVLGIEHVERNGHHYFEGLSMYPDTVQASVLEAHGDLYRRHEKGFPALRISDGALQLGTVTEAPFGIGFELDPSIFTPLSEWTYESLDADS